MTGEYGVLSLLGWYGSEGDGYSIPLFGQSEGANTVCTARCSISGDHGSTIAEFEPVDVNDYSRLPPGESIALGVGDLWHDVFVWNGVGHIGTPAELWTALEPFYGELAERAPLSFLDLALYADREEVLEIGPLALAYVDKGFDRRTAQGWRRQLLRQWLEAELRRKLAAYRDDNAIFRSVAVQEHAPDALTAVVPAPMLRKLTEIGAVGEVSERLAGLAGALGATVEFPEKTIVDAKTGDVRGSDRPPASLPGERLDPSTDVSVIAVGRRSRAVAGHLRRSLKVPWPMAHLGRDGNFLIGSGTRGRSRGLDRSMVSAATIMLLVDEDDSEWAGSGSLDRFLRERVDAGALLILVPALPVRHPSRILERTRPPGKLVGRCHAILDAAIARSPFWWGNSKRSFDRRIADVMAVAGAACRSRRAQGGPAQASRTRIAAYPGSRADARGWWQPTVRA